MLLLAITLSVIDLAALAERWQWEEERKNQQGKK